MSGRRPDERGFTLIEVLLAIAILAAVAAALAPAMQASSKAALEISKFAAIAEEQRIANTVIGDLFNSAITLSSGSTLSRFAGRADCITFLALDHPSDEPREILLQIRKGTLFFSERTPFATSGFNEAFAPDTALFSGLHRFRYFGKTSDDEPALWVDEWNGPELPRLIEIERSVAKSALPRAPMIFLAPSTAPLQCAFDQVSRRCRD